MSWRDNLKNLSHQQLKELAGLCAGMALLTLIALGLSGNLAFLPQSLRLAISVINNNGTNAAAVVESVALQDTTVGTSYWTAPAGVTSVTVTVIGGGGGSGGSGISGDGCSGAGGGSGGYVSNQVVTVVPGNTYTIIVGQRGKGAAWEECHYPGLTWALPHSTAGGDSSFSGPGITTITSTGGQGGTHGPAGNYGGGGAAGTPNGVKGQDSTWYVCGPFSGGSNGSGHGSGGGVISSCYAPGNDGQDGYVSLQYNDSNGIYLDANPSSVPTGTASTLTYGATGATSCSLSGPGVSQNYPVLGAAFNYTGADQPYMVPPGVTSLAVSLWGAGGAYGFASAPGSNTGGGGGYTSGILNVTPGTNLTIIVGQGNAGWALSDGTGRTVPPATYGGGGIPGGGGRSAIRNGGTELITAGGGGQGFGFGNYSAGGPGGGTNGSNALGTPVGGAGGGQAGGGSGVQFTGSNGYFSGQYLGGGGGGGWYGGAGGGSGGTGGSGGGGSGHCDASVSNCVTIAGTRDTPGGASASFLPASIGQGGTSTSPDNGTTWVVHPAGNGFAKIFGNLAASVSTGPLSSPSTYTLTCQRPEGTVSVQATVAIGAAPPPTITLTPPTQTISANNSAQLTWTSVSINAGSCSVIQRDPAGATSTLSSIGAASGDATTKNTSALSQTGTYNDTLTCTAPYTSGNNGTLTGSPTTGVAGKFGQAITFDGATQYANVGHNSSLNPSSTMTISAWVYPTVLSGEQAIVSKYYTSGDSSTSYDLELNGTAARLLVQQSNLSVAQASGGSLAVNTWYHIVGIADGTNLKVYVNGVLAGSGAYNGTINTSSRDTLIAKARAEDFWAGYAGSIDDVRIYNRALSASEVSTLYNGGHITTGLIGYWPFDTAGGINGTTAYDLSGVYPSGGIINQTATVSVQAAPSFTISPATQTVIQNHSASLLWNISNVNAGSCSAAQVDNTTNTVTALSSMGATDGHPGTTTLPLSNTGSNRYTINLYCTAPFVTGNNATLVGSPATTAGQFGQGISLDGGTQYTTTPDAAALNPAAITLSAWVYVTAYPTVKAGDIVSKGDNSGYRFRLNLGGTISWFDRGATNAISSVGTVPLNQWSLVTVTGDASGLKIYINGVLSGSNAVAYGGPVTASPFIIGSDPAFAEYFAGSIDDVRIYNTALAPDRIAALYNGTHITSGLVGYWPFDTAGGISSDNTTAYDLTGGISFNTANVTVNPPPPPPTTIALAPSPSRVQKGAHATLQWTVTGMVTGISCYLLPILSGQPASGLINGLWDGSTNPWTSQGTTAATINQASIYTLTCGNGIATTTKQTTVNLVPQVKEI